MPKQEPEQWIRRAMRVVMRQVYAAPIDKKVDDAAEIISEFYAPERAKVQELVKVFNLIDVHCGMLDHVNGYYHEASEPCPVKARIRAALDKFKG